MSALTKGQLRILEPYLEGGGPNEIGEQGMHCPLHNDKTRSASVNHAKGLWYCQVCDKGGAVKTLTDRLMKEGDEDARPDDDEEAPGEFREDSGVLDVGEDEVEGWCEDLVGNDRILESFVRLRGLTPETLDEFEIGVDHSRGAFTIPVRDIDGELINIRWYNPNPKEGRRKIWGAPGCNDPALYPISQLEGASEIVITEGEWDALMCIQEGFRAVTRTAAAGVWKSEWNPLFAGKVVYICQDMDEAGLEGALKIRKSLTGVAKDVKIVQLPYPLAEKHGKDVTDYFYKDGHEAEDFEELMDEADDLVDEVEEQEKSEGSEVSILESFNSANAGRDLSMRVTITGKKNPPHHLPLEFRYSCDQNAATKCNNCPMADQEGLGSHTVDDHDPILLQMMGASNKQIADMAQSLMGINKCPEVRITTEKYRAVEELFVRPSVDVHRAGDEAGDYTTRKVVSVGRHDSLENNTVEVVGAIHPDPRGQHNEFMAWDVTKTETSIDNFQLEQDEAEQLEIFQSGEPLEKIWEVADDLSLHVTKIYGRPELHAMMDIVYHSALRFELSGVMQNRGWLDCLVVGDTRTGKSEVAERLRHHYEAGEMVSCESASFAGVVGGLQQMGGGNEWAVTWGAIPVNDRRLVILDEVSGLTHEEIGAMSSVRSSGEAQLTKIRSERTFARTRLIWMGNPRNGRMNHYTYGVQAILPLIGNNEDVARFDIAMSVKSDEVESSEINRDHVEPTKQKYDSEDCALLLRWVWSRHPDQIEITRAAEKLIYSEAIALGERYIEVPPLVQSANVRIKLARLAVAIAARTFSTDEDYEMIICDEVHVEAAVEFLDHIYGSSSFGYKELSKEEIQDRKDAARLYDEAKQYLVSNVGLARILRSMGGIFRSQDLQDMMNLSREEAQGLIGSLWKYRLITRAGPNIKIQPVLHEMLREVKE